MYAFYNLIVVRRIVPRQWRTRDGSMGLEEPFRTSSFPSLRKAKRSNPGYAPVRVCCAQHEHMWRNFCTPSVFRRDVGKLWKRFVIAAMASLS